MPPIEVIDAIIFILGGLVLFMTRSYLNELRETRKDVNRLRQALRGRRVYYRIYDTKRKRH